MRSRSTQGGSPKMYTSFRVVCCVYILIVFASRVLAGQLQPKFRVWSVAF